MNHVFISYRQESAAHAAAVRRLADQLQADRLPVVLDQLYVAQDAGGPDGGWARWCIEQAKKSACVLIVCSRGWFEAARGQGPDKEGRGVASEAWIILTEIYRKKSQNTRMRLVILDDFDEAGIPDEFYGWTVFKPLAAPSQSEQMQQWIRQRLAMTSSAASQAAKVVYVPACRFDLRTERANLGSFLQEAGWQVRPDPAAPRPLADDLREALAFVQLLESYPREDGSHRTEFEQAAALPRYRFRHDKIVLAEVEETHRALLTAPGVISGGFDDFKLNLLKELDAVWNKKHAPEPYAAREILVRVVIRASALDPLWDKVFAWIDAQPGMRPELLEGSESFKEKHNPAVPCHGFLIVCDQAAQEGAVSTKTDLEQCMEIQLGERNAPRRPPVGLVFCPPPDEPKWPRLLRVSPPKLHRIVESADGALDAFFAEVRRCAT